MNREDFNQDNHDLKVTRLQLCDIAEQRHAIEHGELRTFTRAIAEWDDAQTAAIVAEINEETGKARFSNAEGRKAELAIRQTSDPARREMTVGLDELERDLASLSNQAARLRVEEQFLAADIQYAINHGADEIAAQLDRINDKVEQVSNVAAYNAVTRVMAELFQSAQKQGEAEAEKLRGV